MFAIQASWRPVTSSSSGYTWLTVSPMTSSLPSSTAMTERSVRVPCPRTKACHESASISVEPQWSANAALRTLRQLLVPVVGPSEEGDPVVRRPGAGRSVAG